MTNLKMDTQTTIPGLEKDLEGLYNIARLNVDEIPAEEIKQQKDFFFFSLAKELKELNTKSFEVTPSLVVFARAINKAKQLIDKFNQNSEKKESDDFLLKIISMDFSGVNMKIEGEITNKYNTEEIQIPKASAFIDLYKKHFKVTTLSCQTLIQCAASFILSDFSENIFERPDPELFEGFECIHESLLSIPEMIVDVENAETLILLRMIYQTYLGKNPSQCINIDNLIPCIIEDAKDKKELPLHDIARILLFFTDKAVDEKLMPFDNDELCLLLFAAGEIDISNSNIKIEIPIKQPIITAAFYYLSFYEDNPFSAFVIDKLASKGLFMAKYIIKEAFADPEMLIDVRKAETKFASAISLLKKPECLEFLNLNNKKHYIIHKCLVKDEAFPETISPESAITLFKMRKTQGNKENVSKLLVKIAEYVSDYTIEMMDRDGCSSSLIKGGFAPISLPEPAPQQPIRSLEEFIKYTDPTPFQLISTMIECLATMEIDQSIAEDIVVLFTHRCIYKDSRNKLIEVFDKAKITPIIDNFRANMIVFAMADSSSPVDVACAVNSLSNVPSAVFTGIIKVLEKTPKLLSQFFMSSSYAKSHFEELSEESALIIVKNIVVCDAAAELAKLSLAKISVDPLLEIAGNNLVAHTEVVDQLVSSIIARVKNLDPFLKSLPETFGDCNDKICCVIAKFASKCMGRHEKEMFEEKGTISTKWMEDAAKTNDSEQEDIWSKQDKITKCPKNIKNGALYKCFTCENTPIVCASCAALCHAHHDVAFIGFDNGNCSCNEATCKCNCDEPSQEIPPAKKNGEENIAHIDPQLLVNTLLKLSDRKGTASSSVENRRFHGDLKTCEIPAQGKTKIPPLVMKPRKGAISAGTGRTMVRHLNKINDLFSLTRRRNEVAPMRLGCTVRNNRFVLESIGYKIRVLSNDLTTKLSKINIPKVVFMVVPCPTDDSIVAVCTLYTVYILEVSESGIITQRSEVELVLRGIDHSIFVNSVAWLPGPEQYLAVTCNKFVKVYNINADLVSPVSSFGVEDGSYITSTALIQHEGKPYGLFCIYPGKIAIQDLTVASTDGMILLQTFVDFEFRSERLTVSYCEEANMVFVSMCERILMTRPEELFVQEPMFTEINTSFDGYLSFAAVYPNTSILLFTHPSTNALFTLEVTDSATEFYCLTSQYINTSSFAALENCMTNLATFVFDNHMITIDNNGTTCDILVNVHREKSADAYLADDQKAESSEEQFTVPVSFWANAKVVRENLDIKGNSRDSMRDIVNGCRYIFDSDTSNKAAFVTLNDTENLIVGFRVCVGSNGERHRPPWISLLGRKINVDSQRFFMLPLKPHEVGIKKKYKICFGSRDGYDINFDRLDVYTMPRAKIEKICASACRVDDWMMSSKLTDFTFDIPSDMIESLPLTLALSYTPSNINDDAFERLVYSVYTNDFIGSAARVILSKCIVEKKEEKWANFAMRVVNKVTEAHKPEFWRDFNLFPAEEKKCISDSIWSQGKESVIPEKEEAEINDDLIVSAFFASV